MVKIKKIDHVAVCVDDLETAAQRWQHVFGLEPGAAAATRELVPSQKTEVMLLRMGGASGAAVELIAPRGNESLARFLDKRGPGLHHIAVEVEGIEQAVAELIGLGVPMIDPTPRIGARGHKVAFVHPKATGGVLIELVEPATAR